MRDDFTKNEIDNLYSLEDKLFENLYEAIYECFTDTEEVLIWVSSSQKNMLCVSADTVENIYNIKYEKIENEDTEATYKVLFII